MPLGKPEIAEPVRLVAEFVFADVDGNEDVASLPAKQHSVAARHIDQDMIILQVAARP